MLKNTHTLIPYLLCVLALSLSACANTAPGGGTSAENTSRETTFRPRDVADAIYQVVAAHRQVYTDLVVNRLASEGIVQAHEDWQQRQTLLLPAQLFRFSAESANQRNVLVDYSLKSLWPINAKNGPQTDWEQVALQTVANTPNKSYYTEEEVEGVRYFIGVYSDLATSAACVSCHNDHPETPKSDFQLDDVMGAVMIRIPLD